MRRSPLSDFADMSVTHLLIGVVQLAVLPYSLSPLGVQSRAVTMPVTLCILLQLYVRWRHGGYGARWFGIFYFCMTCAEWAAILIAQQAFHFSVLTADAVFLILFFIFVFLQGLLLFSASTYRVLEGFLFIPFASCVCALYLYLFTQSTGGGAAEHDTPSVLLGPLAFFALFEAMCVISFGLCLSQLYSRRMHHAELEYLHERLRREKERMDYELALARKRQSQEADARGGRRGRSGSGSIGPGSSGVSSAMSELAEGMHLLKAELEAKRQASLEEESASRRPVTEAARQRQEVLWTTLAEIGIRPKSAGSNEYDLV